MTIIQPPTPPVITAEFIRSVRSNAWALIPVLGGETLETSVNRGDHIERADAERTHTPLFHQVKITNYPVLVLWALESLRYKHPLLVNTTTVGRFVTRAGLPVLERIQALQDLRGLRDQLNSDHGHSNEEAKTLFAKTSVRLNIGHRITGNAEYLSPFTAVYTELQNVATDLCISNNIAVLLVAVAGLVQSDDWVEPADVETFLDALEQLTTALEQKVVIVSRALTTQSPAAV